MERRRSCPFNCSHPREHPIDTTLVFSTVRFDLTKYTFQRHFEGRGGLGSISWKAVHGDLDSPEGVRGDFTGRRPRGPCEGFVAARVALPNAKGVDRLWNVGSGCDNDRLSFFSLSLSTILSLWSLWSFSPNRFYLSTNGECLKGWLSKVLYTVHGLLSICPTARWSTLIFIHFVRSSSSALTRGRDLYS